MTDKPHLNVLHIIYALGVGGAETMLVDIVNGQVQRGASVTLLIVNSGIDSALLSKIDARVRVVRFERTPGSNPLRLLFRLNSFILKLRPDAIHVHNHKLCRMVRVYRKKLLFTVHDMNSPLHYAAPVRMAAITDAVAADVKARIPRARISTVLNGIRTADIPPRTDYSLPPVFRLVQVARLVAEKKGQDILIQALGILRRKGICNVDVTFIGDGPDRDKLQALAIGQGVDTQVHFLGLMNRDSIYRTLRNYHAMCHPSRFEGFGLTVAEGMAAGLPLVLPQGDGPWEVADRGRLCISFPNGDVEACAEAISTLINNYPAAADTAREALSYVRRFDISETVDNYLNLYQEL